MADVEFMLPHALVNRATAASRDGDISLSRYIIGALESYADMSEAGAHPVTPTGATVVNKVMLDLPESLQQKLRASHDTDISMERIIWRGLTVYFDTLDTRYAATKLIVQLPPETYARLRGHALNTSADIDLLLRRAIAEYVFTNDQNTFPNGLLRLPEILTPEALSHQTICRIPSYLLTALEDLQPQHAENNGREDIAHVIARALQFYSNGLGNPPAPEPAPFIPTAKARATTKKLRL